LSTIFSVLTTSSNVLVVGTQTSLALGDTADFVDSYTKALQRIRKHSYAVVVFGLTPADNDLEAFCLQLKSIAPAALWLVLTEDLPAETALRISNHPGLYAWIDNWSDPDLPKQIQLAIEAVGEVAQREQLLTLFEERSRMLSRMSTDLESRIEKRQKALRKSLRKLEETKLELATLHKALIAIQRATSPGQMETALNEALTGVVDFVRIRFASQSSLADLPNAHVLTLELPKHMEPLKGEVRFGKFGETKFTPTETDFLQELMEAIALALARMAKLEQAELVKGHWQATFDSITHPLCVTTPDLQIVKLNRAYQKACAEHTFRALLGKPSLPTFFGSEFRPPRDLETPFSFRQARPTAKGIEHYEVTGQSLGEASLIRLREITDEVRFERQLVEAAKLAELGTIGSSMAHELNNPLGGMLSFLQLARMDLPAESALLEDIKAMEEAVCRCRDIVLNLLSFARKQDFGSWVIVDFWSVLSSSIKLIELKSKTLSVEFQVEGQAPHPSSIKAYPTALIQALCHLMQNALDAISHRRRSEPDLSGKISLTLESRAGFYELRIHDNGSGIEPHVINQIFNPRFTTRDPDQFQGMGLTTTFSIVGEHQGQLEIFSQTGSGTTALVTIPMSLDQSPERQDFDGQI